MRGRKPKPLALAQAEGDTRKLGVRKLATAIAREPKSSPFLPPPPQNMLDGEKAEYEAIKQSVEDLGLEDQADSCCLELAAIAVNEAKQSKSGQALRTALAYLSSLGCGGPASRARLAIEKKDDGEKELMAMLSKPRAAKDAVQ